MPHNFLEGREVVDVHLQDVTTNDLVALVRPDGSRKWAQVIGIFCGCTKPPTGRLWVTDGIRSTMFEMTTWRRKTVRIARLIAAPGNL